MDHIGIDVHKNQSQVCIIKESDERIEQRILTDRVRIAEVFGGRPGADLAPGRCGFEVEFLAASCQCPGR